MGLRLRRAVERMIACGVMMLASGCSDWIRQSAVEAIASRMQPPDSAIITKLESSANPLGEGVIVLVRSERSCAPRYAWIWLNDRTPSYALDDASQALTPDLRTLLD